MIKIKIRFFFRNIKRMLLLFKRKEKVNRSLYFLQNNYHQLINQRGSHFIKKDKTFLYTDITKSFK
jgi:hypothetical protein